MYNYGDNWNQALNKILKRLAVDEQPGFLILDGPGGSGKTDLLDLVRKIIRQRISVKEAKNEENFKLAEKIYSKRYLSINLGATDSWASIPTIIIDALTDKICSNGANKNQNILLMWDNIDKVLSGQNQEVNMHFLEEIRQPLKMYKNITFICTITSQKGNVREILDITAGPSHIIHL